MRSGFTLVETLVALVLFEIGMLALAATGAIAARDVAIARRTAQARDIARNRVEALHAVACAIPGAGDGFAVGGLGVTERWRVDASGAMRAFEDSVSFALPAGRRGTVVIRGATLCAP